MHHFETMPADAKAWIYAASRKLTPAEQEIVHAHAGDFVSGWTAHENPLKASFDLLHDVFLVLMVDEQVHEVSGCGIDKSVHFIQELEKKLNIALFNRLQVEYLYEDNVVITTKAGAAKLYADGIISDDTVFFNKNVTAKKDLDERFMIPFSSSWAYQGLPKTTPA